MKTALVLSSFVAASRVGATASAFSLRRLGIETIVLPTTVLGRHPGWGAPGGQALEAAHLRSMWEAIKAQDITIDGVLTGYLGVDDQIELALDIIADVKAVNPEAIIVVDPVMGDNGKLYIPETRAAAIKSKLLVQANIITPNAWEFSYITGCDPESLASIKDAAKHIEMQSLITSVPIAGDIGALYNDNSQSVLVCHKKFKAVPHGGGDALSGTFLAHLLNEASPHESLAKSVSTIFSILSAAVKTDAGELPLIRMQDAFINSAPLKIEIL